MFEILIDIYANAQSCIQLNGKYSESFPCNIGVRQGCPLSPVLFTLFIHDLLDEIREFCGIMLGPRRLCGLMFADDLVQCIEEFTYAEKELVYQNICNYYEIHTMSICQCKTNRYERC